MKVQILESALDDLRAGRRFYVRQGGRDLGRRFLETLADAIGRLSEYGGLHVRRFGFYRAVVARFPYSVYYDVEGDTVRVYAVVDNRRNPSWVESRVEAARDRGSQEIHSSEGGKDTPEYGEEQP